MLLFTTAAFEVDYAIGKNGVLFPATKFKDGHFGCGFEGQPQNINFFTGGVAAAALFNIAPAMFAFLAVFAGVIAFVTLIHYSGALARFVHRHETISCIISL